MSSTLTSKSIGGKRLVMLGVYVAPDLKRKLDVAVKILGTSNRAFVIECLELGFQKHSGELPDLEQLIGG